MTQDNMLSAEQQPANIGYAMRPLPGEVACGDRCGAWVMSDRIVLALADGLGHGPHAAHAAETALSIIAAQPDLPCDRLFEQCDQLLRGTRGVALSIAVVEPACQRVTLAAVGNVRSVLLQPGRDRRLLGTCGIVGGGYTGLTPESLPLEKGDVLALYSDGLAELLPLRELLRDNNIPPQELAETALTRWASDIDDSSILVYRHDGCDHDDECASWT